MGDLKEGDWHSPPLVRVWSSLNEPLNRFWRWIGGIALGIAIMVGLVCCNVIAPANEVWLMVMIAPLLLAVLACFAFLVHVARAASGP